MLASALFAGTVAVYCWWVFSLPLFPSQDGPVHLYYTSVISRLLSGSPLFSQFFALRHPTPPYIFHYLLLLAFNRFLDPLPAEKCVVCLIIIAFCYGILFLVRTINPNNRIAAAFAVPLSLNWALGMGFHNYCLSLAFSFWAIGLWLRANATGALRLRVLFLAIAFLMLFTHPVPLFVLLAFIAADTALRMVQTYRKAKRENLSLSLGTVGSKYAADLVTVALAFLSVLYIALFVNTHRTAENLHHSLIQRGMIFDFLRLRPLMLTNGGLGAVVYGLFLYALLAGALWIGLRGLSARWKTLELRSADLMLIAAVVLEVFYPVLPRSINGSDYFADRLMIYIWLFALLGAANYLSLTRRDRQVAAWAACAVALFVLASVNREIRPTAETIAQIETDKIAAPGSRGIFIDAPVKPAFGKLTFDPFTWTAARYFRRADAVMLNAPWLDQPHMPVGPGPKLLTNFFPPRIMNSPDGFAGLLIQSEKARDFVSPETGFLIFIGQSDRDPKVVDNVLKQEWPHPWTCERTGWYSVCTNPSRATAARPLLR